VGHGLAAVRPRPVERPATLSIMQAIAVRPGEPGSLHRRDVPWPSIDDVPGGRGVLVRVLQVGLCGTDAEIADGRFGHAPPGDEFLVLGHEHLGQVIAVGAAVDDPDLRPGRLVVASNRRPGTSLWDRVGLQDFTADAVTHERGIRGVHGFLVEAYVDEPAYLTPVPDALLATAVLTEPMSIVQKGIAQAWSAQRRLHLWRPMRALVVGAGTIGLLAVLALRLRGIEVTCFSRRRAPYRNSELVEAAGAGYASAAETDIAALARRDGPFDLVFEASGAAELVPGSALALAPNGILVLTSVTSLPRPVEVDIAAWNQSFVLGNRAMVGTVNSAPADFATAVGDLARATTEHPGWLEALLTTRIEGLDRDAIARQLHGGDAIKAWIHIADPVPAGG
jgi:threonine dehydrogenase-like Zn-dependent dehydrogenase